MKCYGETPVDVRGVWGRLVFIGLGNKILERERVEENVGGLRSCGSYSEVKWEKLR